MKVKAKKVRAGKVASKAKGIKQDTGKKLIIEAVTNYQGLKLTELASLDELADIAVVDLVNELIKEGNLVEVEYVLPSMNYRVKSFILPKGTEVDVRAHSQHLSSRSH